MTPSTHIEAGQEVAAPRQQITQEAAELQRAVSGGEVDAFVVGQSEDRKRVLMLSDAHLRYQLLAMYQEKQQTLQDVLETKR